MPTQPAILGSMRLGNFRLGYESAALAAVRATRVQIYLAGVESRSRVRLGLTIHDALNEEPNTCSLTVDGSAPTVGQALRITINSDTPRLLFNGTLQSVDLSYEGQPSHWAWACSAIDDLARLNRRIPFGTWTSTSATTIAQALIASFAPGFTATYVQAALDGISIKLDGSEGFTGALRQIAQLIGGYFYVEDLNLHLFLSEATDTPDPVQTGYPFLDNPPITASRDLSQIRTRVYGKGHGEPTLSDVAPSDTIVPVASAVMFSPPFIPYDGLLISETQRATYVDVQLGGPGSIVGPPVAPSVAPVLTAVAGAGLGVGVYGGAYTFVTAAGESMPSPLTTVTAGPIADPGSLPTLPANPTFGGGPDVGLHYYGVSFVVGAGETQATISTNNVTTRAVSPPGAPSVTLTEGIGCIATAPGASCAVAYSYVGSGGETTIGASTTVVTTACSFNGAYCKDMYISVVASPETWVTGINIYVNRNGGGWKFVVTKANATGSHYGGYAAQNPSGVAPPGTNTAILRTVPLTTIPTGPAGTTGRNIYRTAAGAAYSYANFKLVGTIANNTTTTYTDTLADASLGAAAPSSNTAIANQVAVSGIALGPTGTTARKYYRTVVNGSQLKLQQTIANNTATVGVQDATADGSLGANAPTVDTSGLSMVSGQVNAGSTSLQTSGSAPFVSTGGWAQIGQQIVRYTGITGNTLTGIPASGIGAILSTLRYGDHVDPTPALTGVVGFTSGLLKDAPVNIWVQRDDLAAQAAQAALDGGDGIYEYFLSDERRGIDSLTALCDAHLALFGRPIVTVSYATRDVKTKSGKTIVVNLSSPPISETLTIQDVTITEIDSSPGTAPKFTVTASTVRHSLDHLLSQLAGTLSA